MRKFLLVLGCVFLIGCVERVQKEDLSQLNGYWEITEVEFANGKKKEYKINLTVDYIEWKGDTGFRKKMYPQFNGSYKTSSDAEPFTVSQKDGEFILLFGDGSQQHEEVLLTLTEDYFSIRNSEDRVYSYKRFKPITLAP